MFHQLSLIALLKLIWCVQVLGRGGGGGAIKWSILAESGYVISNATMTYAPLSLGRRRRGVEVEELQGDGDTNNQQCAAPEKKPGGTSGILEEKRSAAKTRHNPVARIPEKGTNDIPKEACRGSGEVLRPRMCMEYTTNPRWYPELSCAASTALCSNSKRREQNSSRYPAYSSLDLRVGRSRQSSVASARTRGSSTLRIVG